MWSPRSKTRRAAPASTGPACSKRWLAGEQGCDLLLVYRVDRLSRKVRQLAGLCEGLDLLKVVLKSVTEPFDTGSAAGRMMLQMLGVFAEFEHATIVDRVTAGLERRVREGKWMSGRTPYGYSRDPETKLLIPDPVKAPVVRRIFSLYADGKLGTTSLARQLDAEGAPSPRKQGWSANALQLILTSPAYRGLVRWKNETQPGLHEPLIDQETFEKAQIIMGRRGQDATLRRGNPTEFLLSGLSAASTAAAPTSARARMVEAAVTPTTPARPATSTGRANARATGCRRTASSTPSSPNSPRSTATATPSSARSRPPQRQPRGSGPNLRTGSAPRAPRSRSSNGSWNATSKRSRTASSQPPSAKSASAASEPASKHSTPTRPTSPASSPQTGTQRPTRPSFPASLTKSKASLRPRDPNRPKNSSGSSSKRSACTTAAGSSRPIGFRQRFAQRLLRWAEQGSNLRPWD